MTHLFDQDSGTFSIKASDVKMDMINKVVGLVKSRGVVVSPRDVIMTRLGDSFEFRCYVPMTGVTTTRNKRLAASVVVNTRSGEIIVDTFEA